MIERRQGLDDSAPLRYGIAITISVLAMLLKLQLRRYLGDTVPFVLFFSAVMVSAWFGGIGPGILSTAICTGLVAGYFMSPGLGFWGRFWPLLTFTVEGIGISFLSHSRRRVLKDRTTLLQREREAREQAEHAGQRLNEALENIKTEMTQRERSEESLRQAGAEREGLLSSERAARTEAERASRMKDEFLATLSHELRTPLNAILGWSQILSADAPNHEDMAEGLAAIQRNARTQTQIIEDLLDMSRIISGKISFNLSSVDLPAIVRAAADTVKPAADAKGVRLLMMLDAQTDRVRGDPSRLQQVFWNLLNNAVKFTPRGGRVQVLLERANSRLELSVSDTGEGISAEFLPYVFDRFRQSDASTTRRHGGLGLGLAIVKQLVELHGGEVRVSSPGEGKGATFTVSLPLSVIETESVPIAQARERRANDLTGSLENCADLAGLKVLVVDDEPDVRSLLKRLFEECHATVILASSAQQAVELMQTHRPDVMASDIGMPGEDGYALIRRIRALPAEQGGQTPALALTAYARPEDRLKVIDAGFQRHLAKPVEPLELIATIASLARPVRGEEIVGHESHFADQEKQGE